jgi:hypothetical protein
MASTITPLTPRFDRKVSIRFEGRQWEQIEAIAARHGVSPAQAARCLLERCLAAEAQS